MNKEYKVLETYNIQVVEFKNGYKAVREEKDDDNYFCNGLYIYADKKYNKEKIDDLLANAIPKKMVQTKIQKYIIERNKIKNDTIKLAELNGKILALMDILNTR